MLFGRFADSQKLRFQASKRSNMCSGFLEGGRSADIHEFCFQAGKRSDMDCVELQRGLFVECDAWIIRSRIFQIINNYNLQESRFADVHE